MRNPILAKRQVMLWIGVIVLCMIVAGSFAVIPRGSDIGRVRWLPLSKWSFSTSHDIWFRAKWLPGEPFMQFTMGHAEKIYDVELRSFGFIEIAYCTLE